jgi:UDP-glucose 4-epimerase
MHTILVTGGAGFIGSHVSASLYSPQNRIVIFDNLSTGQKTAIPKHAIFVKGDVRSNTAVDTAIKKYKPDVVCHIAGQASNINSFTDPHADADVNYKGTINVVTACVGNRVPRLVYASSMLAANPTSYYGISKYAAERFVHATALRPDLGYPLRVTSLRMFNVYGPGQSIDNPYQGVLAIFIGNVLRGEPIRIFGSGRQTRDFIYIDDVCEAWKRVIHNPKSYGKVLDLGSGKPISINRLAAAVIAACGRNPKTYPVIHAPPRPGDLPVVRANRITHTILFSEGLHRTVEWAKHNS